MKSILCLIAIILLGSAVGLRTKFKLHQEHDEREMIRPVNFEAFLDCLEKYECAEKDMPCIHHCNDVADRDINQQDDAQTADQGNS